MASGMIDGVKGYLQLASGLSAVTRQRAMDVARSMLPLGEAPAEQVSRLADDLLATSRANRAAMTTLVRSEVDRALGRLGLAGRDDVAHLDDRIKKLERQVRDLASAVEQIDKQLAERPAPRARRTKPAAQGPAQGSAEGSA